MLKHMSKRTVVDGVNLHYVVAGEGPVVLGMRGRPQNQREFLPLIRLRLIARKRLVAVRQAPQIGHDKSILACELFDAQPPTARSSYVDVPPYMKFDRTARPGTAIY